MKKGILAGIVLFLLFTFVSRAQWVNEGAWPDATNLQSLHGIAVDPDGKVWAGSYYSVSHEGDGGASDIISTRVIYVYNPDGSQASFSPIWKVTVGGVTDTLKSSCTGMRADQNGNLIYVTGSQLMYRFNYQTGEGMNKVALNMGTTPTSPAVSASGEIFVGPVVNANHAIQEYDSDFNPVDIQAVPFIYSDFSRSMECSADGNTLYFPMYANAKAVVVYNRASELDPFDSVGTILDGFACESMVFNKATGNLWASAGSYNDLPGDPSYTADTWYEYNIGTDTILDSLKWTFVGAATKTDSANQRPRAIDFSPDGKIAYIGCFAANNVYPMIERVVSNPEGVVDQGQVVINGYKLSQNYPNPFNPSTKITFQLPVSGYTTLKVYDMLGNEIVTLIQDQLASGDHTVNFNASNLASGTYIYQLNVNGNRLTNKMILLK